MRVGTLSEKEEEFRTIRHDIMATECASNNKCLGKFLRRRAFVYGPALIFSLIVFFALTVNISFSAAEELRLDDVISEALHRNPEIRATQSRSDASRYRISQVKALPDPMVMFGYQNEGWNSYTYGEMPDSQWMFSASQMFPFPGKRSLKGRMQERDAESLRAEYESSRRNTVLRVKERFYDLLYLHKTLDSLSDKSSLFWQIEGAAAARYSAGMAPQQEVLMAQTEKYMLMEREQMVRQKIEGLSAMLNSDLGRDPGTPVGRPEERQITPVIYSAEEYVRAAYENSPEIASKQKMLEASGYRVEMAKKEYYPDFTVAGSVFKRGGEFDDMWSLTTTVNVPIFYRTKQRSGVLEAESILSQSRQELEGVKLMIASGLRDSYSMIKYAERLMELYREGLIPKAEQNFHAALAGYTTGRTELITLLRSLSSWIDYELLYWNQFAEREKAVARVAAFSGEAPEKSGPAEPEK